MNYELVVETAADDTVRLRLSDGDGTHRGSNQVKLSEHSRYWWEGLFDTRRHIERYEGSQRDAQDQVSTAEAILEQLGVFLGEKVLGHEIITELCKSKQQRTLVVRLPVATDDALAAAFARIPWEIARPGAGTEPLMERNLVVRVTTEDTRAGDSAVRRVAADLAESGGVVRVLLVYAETPGSQPLAMRRERELLRKLFEDKILPKRKVEVEVLCHGVTRDVLRARISAMGGFHIVHWSGHGHHNTLDLLNEDGGAHSITGEELVKIFVDAGGFIPQLFFLSACLSGTLVDEQNWATLQGAKPGADDRKQGSPGEGSQMRVLKPDEVPGYTGTALALLSCGVPQVVAMRYSVGDSYARELAGRFYERLLVDQAKHTTEAALALARTDVIRGGATSAKWAPVDHANPLMFGQAGRLLDPAAGRSQQMKTLRPKPSPLLPSRARELDRPSLFVGRGRELTKINRAWSPGGAAVAMVQGMAGLGKTVLAAEALHLWHDRFDWVLAFQAKPTALSVEEFLRQVDGRLTVASAAYRDKCGENPLERVYLEPEPSLRGEARYQQMCANLVEVLRDEAVLLVLDNFESNLEERSREGGYACADPHWDAVLKALSELLSNSRSRVLITTRHRPSALRNAGTLWLPLGPLPWGEAVLYIRNHDELAPLWGDEDGRGLLMRMLRVSRGHPIILERLAALVGDRKGLDAALTRLMVDGLEALPELTVPLSAAQAKTERSYLEDVAKDSVDILLERASASARRLLWVVTLANEPVTDGMLAGLWAGRSVADEQMQKLRELLANRDEVPEELREEFDALASEFGEQLEAAEPGGAGEQISVGPLLTELHEAGLLSREDPAASKPGASEARVAYAFHELVRERVAAWMDAQPEERGEWTAERVWLAYGQRYAGAFEGLHRVGAASARKRTLEAGRRALVYLIRAREFDALASFASTLVTGTRDPVLLRNVIVELRAVADQVPAGRARWGVQTYLADALYNSGRPDEALPLFEQAAAEAEEAEHWADFAWICGNWANALRDVGELDAARTNHLRSAEAKCKAGHPRADVAGSELEALRVDVMQDEAERALPEIEAKLEKVRSWWMAHIEGESVAEAADPELLARVLVAGLDIVWQANLVLERWQPCLDLTAEIEQVERTEGSSEHKLAITRFSLHGPLLRLNRLDEAQQVLEHCLTTFREVSDLAGESKALSGLACLWDQRGDRGQAADLERQALSVCNGLPNPEDRAISHHNLANYLGNHADATAHLLAAIAYDLVSGHRRNLAMTLRNVADRKCRAAAVGESYGLPRLAIILPRPSFDALRRFLADRHADLDELQTVIDQIVAQADPAPHTPKIADLPAQLRELLAPLFEAAASGQDVDPLLVALRTKLVEQSPENEPKVDDFLALVPHMLAELSSTP